MIGLIEALRGRRAKTREDLQKEYASLIRRHASLKPAELGRLDELAKELGHDEEAIEAHVAAVAEYTALAAKPHDTTKALSNNKRVKVMYNAFVAEHEKAMKAAQKKRAEMDAARHRSTAELIETERVRVLLVNLRRKYPFLFGGGEA